MGDSVKSLAEVKVDNIHGSPFILFKKWLKYLESYNL